MNGVDLFDYGMHYALRALPPAACSQVGASLSPVLGKKAHPDQHRNAVALFAALRPDWTDAAAREAAADRLWANIGRTFAEFAVSHRMLRTGRVAVEGRHHFEAGISSGRPIVAIFPHLGNWELSEMQFGFEVPHRGAVIVAPPASAAKARIAERVRSRAPAELLEMSATVWRRALARLKTPGGILMLAVDEQMPDGRVMSPFFGRDTVLDGNLAKAARLALLNEALVMPFYNERLPGARFVTHHLPGMVLDGKAGDPGAVQAGVERMEAALRAPIVRLIDQWYMALFARAQA